AYLDPTDGSGPPSVFFCGRHEHRKGLGVLIDAVCEGALDVRVWIAGHGPETEVLRARTADDARFEWLGRVTDDEKFARLRAADVFCAPSLGGESFGVVLIEAMAAGTTVVASALDGYQNVATDGADALLAPPGDAPALAAALSRATHDVQLAATLRRAGDARAEAFSMRSLVDAYVEMYGELTAAARR
ncbi:MAG: glycosyltransferase family 4 protein, partial [Actinomycetota bacterium]